MAGSITLDSLFEKCKTIFLIDEVTLKTIYDNIEYYTVKTDLNINLLYGIEIKITIRSNLKFQ